MGSEQARAARGMGCERLLVVPRVEQALATVDAVVLHLLRKRQCGGAQLPVRSRCLQPGQQHGRRMPSSSSSRVRRMRRSRVLACLASSTQQMNSLRARGVMSCQASSAAGVSFNPSQRSRGKFVHHPAGQAPTVHDSKGNRRPWRGDATALRKPRVPRRGPQHRVGRAPKGPAGRRRLGSNPAPSSRAASPSRVRPTRWTLRGRDEPYARCRFGHQDGSSQSS